jgi:hypothetical protein
MSSVPVGGRYQLFEMPLIPDDHVMTIANVERQSVKGGTRGGER